MGIFEDDRNVRKPPKVRKAAARRVVGGLGDSIMGHGVRDVASMAAAAEKGGKKFVDIDSQPKPAKKQEKKEDDTIVPPVDYLGLIENG